MTLEERKKYKCPYCEKNYLKNSHVKAHINRAHSKNPVMNQCPDCPDTFYDKSSLKTHLYIHEGTLESRQKFPCLTCELRFARKADLNRHMKLHEGGRNTQRCPDTEKYGCRKLFDTIEEAVAHANRGYFDADSSTGFKCRYCGKEYSRSGLSYHVWVEHCVEGQSRIPCWWPNCNQDFKHPNGLTCHIQIKHELIGHPCPMKKEENCNVLYITAKQARRHAERVHLGIRNHLCEQCGELFAGKGDVKLHKTRVHDGEGVFFQCTVPSCPRTVSGRPFHSCDFQAHMTWHEKLGHLEGLDTIPAPKKLSGRYEHIRTTRDSLASLDNTNQATKDKKVDKGKRAIIFDEGESSHPRDKASLLR